MLLGGIVFYSYGNLLMQHNCKKRRESVIYIRVFELWFYPVITDIVIFSAT